LTHAAKLLDSRIGGDRNVALAGTSLAPADRIAMPERWCSRQ
jgi:hypothetical protein